MYALIAWNSKNGVLLEREELEVQSSGKLTVMNGGKMETGNSKHALQKGNLGRNDSVDSWYVIIQSHFDLDQSLL